MSAHLHLGLLVVMSAVRCIVLVLVAHGIIQCVVSLPPFRSSCCFVSVSDVHVHSSPFPAVAPSSDLVGLRNQPTKPSLAVSARANRKVAHAGGIGTKAVARWRDPRLLFWLLLLLAGVVGLILGLSLSLKSGSSGSVSSS